MKISRIAFLFLAALSLSLSSCFNLDRKQEKEPEVEVEVEEDPELQINIDIGDDINKALNEGLNEGMSGLKEALNELEQSLENIDVNEGERVEPIEARELKAFLPDRVNGMKQVYIESDRSGWGNFVASVAKADYEDGDKQMEISLIDAGGMMGLMKIGSAAWTKAEVDRETPTGYERTTIIDGHKAYEKYDSKTKNGQIAVLINDRFIASIEGSEISERDLKTALRKLRLDDLEKKRRRQKRSE